MDGVHLVLRKIAASDARLVRQHDEAVAELRKHTQPFGGSLGQLRAVRVVKVILLLYERAVAVEYYPFFHFE